jgi:hypothetical protein
MVRLGDIGSTTMNDGTTTVATGSRGARIAFKVLAPIFAVAALGGLLGSRSSARPSGKLAGGWRAPAL